MNEFANWLRGNLDGLVEESLSETVLNDTPFIAGGVASVQRAYDRSDDHWSRVWVLVVLSQWIDLHLSSSEHGHSTFDEENEWWSTGDKP